MTKRASRPLLNRLLSGREGLSRPDKEDVLATVLARSAPKRAWWTLPSVRIAALAVATASAIVAVVWLRPADDGDFTPRGTPASSFELSCLTNGVAGPCHEGSTVAFRLDTPTPGHFSALTITADGSALWYFHDVETRSGVLDRAPVLPSLPNGPLTIVGLFTSAPVDKATLRERLERADPSLTVVRRSLTVEP